ncbi:MAG: phosphatase PAP2 family protein, partial [Bacteroidota bacterium]|nr:phosphatase PAP2 family protein [Bacteroidota bacterium]
MKKLSISISVLMVLIFLAAGCRKDVANRTGSLGPLQVDNNDTVAGAWKTVLLSRPDSFAVAAPVPTSSPLYTADLFEIKALQKNLSKDQENSIRYWAAGGVLRWNEILRGLVAKYNLPVVQSADGSYAIPNANNPLAYPLFPFTNPPYAARAYGYIAAAQYDALVACWYYKMKYKRVAPYKFDSAISVNSKFINKTDLPSYPSEAAVLAGVTAEMMKLLFPGEIANIQAKAVEHEQATIMSGAATRADISAGEALGRQVAELFIARARGDNAGKAVGTPADWSNFVTVCIGQGTTPWYSLETPQRPPMLPLFNRVKPFLFDSATVVSLRPGPPPSVGTDQMNKDVAEVKNYVDHPTRENLRIVQYWADGAGTYTPPGHWNAIAAEDFVKQNYSEVRFARNMALLDMTMMDAAIVCWDIKYHYFNPRPSQVDHSIKTLTGIPNFPAYVSGHSTFSGAAATILGYLLPSNATMYNAMAQEAGLSRLVGGIHYRTDCETGLSVGNKVGNFAI